MDSLKLIPMIFAAFIVCAIGYYVLTTPDTRDAGQRIGDAFNELHNGPDKAARQLQSRTPGDKLKDAAQDEKTDIKKALNQQ